MYRFAYLGLFVQRNDTQLSLVCGADSLMWR